MRCPGRVTALTDAPPELRKYLCRLASRLHDALGRELLGVYAGGSLRLGTYVAGQSRVHVAAVTRRRLLRGGKRQLADAVRHESLACPARALVLVVYEEASAGDPAAATRPELALETGAGLSVDTAFAANAAARQRLTIERAILAEHGISLFGPEAAQLFAYVPREVVLAALPASVREQLDQTRDSYDPRAFLAQVARHLETAR